MSPKAVSSWERGESTPTPRLRPQLAEALEVTRAGLDALLFPVDRPALPGHAVPEGLNHRDSLIRKAGRVAIANKSVVPNLLQTRPYALGLERSVPRVTEEWVEQRVQFRLNQQDLLEDENDPLQLTALVHESALEERAGDSAVMLGQLEHLHMMSARSNVELRPLPRGTGGLFWSTEFELLYKKVADSGLVEPEAFMAITFLPGGFDYHELLVDSFSVLMADLLDVALTREESRHWICEQMERYR